jgi:hypothetical protein
LMSLSLSRPGSCRPLREALSLSASFTSHLGSPSVPHCPNPRPASFPVLLLLSPCRESEPTQFPLSCPSVFDHLISGVATRNLACSRNHAHVHLLAHQQFCLAHSKARPLLVGEEDGYEELHRKEPRRCSQQIEGCAWLAEHGVHNGRPGGELRDPVRLHGHTSGQPMTDAVLGTLVCEKRGYWCAFRHPGMGAANK